MGTPQGYELIAVSNAVKTLTSAKYNGQRKGVVTVEDGAIRFTLDGTTPDNAVDGAADVGHLANIGTQILLRTLSEVAGFKAIRAAAVDAEIRATYGV